MPRVGRSEQRLEVKINPCRGGFEVVARRDGSVAGSEDRRGRRRLIVAAQGKVVKCGQAGGGFEKRRCSGAAAERQSETRPVTAAQRPAEMSV